MGKAVICPICNGKGKLREYGKEKICHGCNGRGWVEVND